MRYLLFWIVIFPSFIFSNESVYCIHGFMRKPSSMKPMARAFQKRGYEAHVWDYPSRKKTIEEHADSLVQDLKQTALKHPHQPIHFVTHSLGGLIVRRALNHPDCPEEAKIGRAVLLVPPNRGSRLGRFLNKIEPMRKIVGIHSGRELFTHENFDNLGFFPSTMDVLVISGTFGWNPVVGEANDGKVGVSEACLNTPHKHMRVFSGHSWIMYSDTVIFNALKFIEAL